MFQKSGTICSILLLVFLLSTCTRNLIEISQTSFKDEIAHQENLTFTFSKAIVGDSVLNMWDTTRYIKFSPQVEGKFKWIAPNQVIFSPSKGFLPSTDYQAKLSETLIKGKTSKIPLNLNQTIKFHTTYLKLESAQAFWSKDDRRTNQLHIHLIFNHQIAPQSLQSLLQIRSEGTVISNFKILNNEPSNIAELVLEETSNLDLNDKKIDITVQSGLKCLESDFTTPTALTQSVTAPNKNKLIIEQMTAEYDQEQAQIRVRSNQSIPLSEVIQNLKIEPKIVYEVQPLENGFLIKGAFRVGGTYQVKLNNKMEGVFGVSLKQDIDQEVTFNAMDASISFISKKAVYLSSAGAKNIGIRINNVSKVEIVVYKIFENNLLHFFRENQYAYSYDDLSYSNLGNFGDEIYRKEVETKTLPLVNDFRVLNMDFDNLNTTKGVYIVEVISADAQFVSDRKMVSISDIGLIVKESRDDVLVFANSILSAQPLQGVKINIISQSNQTLTRMETNAEGVAVFKDLKKKYPDAKSNLITALYNQDFNYMHLGFSRVDKSNFETGGMRESPSGYQAFLYGERDLYRPGETVNLNVIVRNRNWKPVSNIPLKFRFRMPNGKDLVNIKGTLSAQGAMTQSVNLPSNATTGTYFADVYTSTDALLTTMPISVEEFMPDRIKVKVRLLEKDLKTTYTGDLREGDSVRVELNAMNLFGPPAVDRDFQLNFSMRKKIFSSKNYPAYNFNVVSQRHSEGYDNLFYNLTSRDSEGRTDNQGNSIEAFKIPEEYANMGLLQGDIYATVFDETGRPVSKSLSFDVPTQSKFIGIKEGDFYVSTNQPHAFSLIALNTKQSPVSSKAIVQVIRYRWQTVLEKSSYGDLRYVSKRKDEVIKEEAIDISTGGSMYYFTPQFSGDYEVLVRLPEAKTFVSQRFYAYGFNSTDNNAFEVDKNGKIDITFDKESYKIGEQAKVLFTTPFNGRMLITIERNHITEYRYINTQNKSATYIIPVTSEHLPNVYVTATLIKPLSDGAIPLTVAHGFAPLQVEDVESKLNLSIEAVERTESRQKQTIKVKTNRAESDIEVTLAVVDEGILQLKNYASPNPHEYFYQKRALETEAFDLYPQLFPEINLNQSSTGGGGVEAMTNRNSPMINKRVKLTRFWSGILKTNASGEVTYTIDIPQFSGSLRIMAVAYKDGKFGAISKNMTVADPIVVSTGLPRFLSPRDKITVPVTLTNTTNNSTNAQIGIQTTSNLTLIGDKTKNAEIKGNNEIQTYFEIEAKPVIDSAKVTVSVNAMGKVYTEELDINIRPTVGLVKDASSGSIRGGASQVISFNQELIPSTAKAKLVVSRSPLVQFAKNLDYLIHYPYGCVEQVTSSVFPQLYAADLMKVITPQKQNLYLYNQEIKENIEEGIMQLLAMQNYSGGLSYWSGSFDTHLFGTAYATHFLLEAKKAGYQVPQANLEQMIEYLRNQTDNRPRESYQFTNANGRLEKKESIASKAAIYALYVLAIAQKEDISTMNYYKENPDELALDSKYLLAAAYLILGDNKSYQTILPANFSGEISSTALSGSFYSPIRDEALALNALLEADENNIQIPRMAQHLSEQIRNAKYLNTNESAFALMALGKLAKKTAQSNITATIGTGNNAPLAFSGNDVILTKDLLGNKININAQGQGSLFYFWQTEGLSATGKVAEGDNRLKVRRTFYDRNGNVIRDNIFKQNDLVIVKITISAEPFYANIDNVAITDMLPAGLEIENPRLTGANQAVRWLRNSDNPDHFDIRDDRIHLFVNVGNKPQNFYYLARAVTVGTFQLGPVSADAMYNGEFYSYNGAGKVQIVSKRNWNN